MIDRSEVNRALAKAIAFKQCGKQAEAEQWAERLVELLECEGILYRPGRESTDNILYARVTGERGVR